MEQLNQIQICENDKKDAVLEILADKHCMKILQYTKHELKSILEMSRDLNIPMSAVYRKIPLLQETNMISTSGEIGTDGRKYFLYKNKVKEIVVTVNGITVDIKITRNG